VHSQVTAWIDAPPETLYELVADLARWPERLPHYRYVRILRHSAGGVRAAMSARRGSIPVFWEALQTLDPSTLEIGFLHVRGVTRGMRVLWTFRPEDGGTRARIVHDLTLGWPLVGAWVADRVIARGFIAPIAGRTLSCFKALAEAGRSAAPRGAGP